MYLINSEKGGEEQRFLYAAFDFLKKRDLRQGPEECATMPEYAMGLLGEYDVTQECSEMLSALFNFDSETGSPKQFRGQVNKVLLQCEK